MCPRVPETSEAFRAAMRLRAEPVVETADTNYEHLRLQGDAYVEEASLTLIDGVGLGQFTTAQLIQEIGTRYRMGHLDPGYRTVD